MEQLEKRKLLKHAKNEYLGAMLAAKVARRLHSMEAADREDPDAKVTSLALKLITQGKVEYEIEEYDDDEVVAEEEGEEEEKEKKKKK